MNPLMTIAAIASAAFGLMAWACYSARRRAVRDWRENWCTFDCWAPDGQTGPCRDCPVRMAARR